MNECYWENKYRPTTVCVDSYSDFIMKGRLYNLYLPDGQQFSGLMQLLLCMDNLFNEMDFPKAYTAPRRFSREPVRIYKSVADTDALKGSVATFDVRVILRQHASWQGTVTWIEGKQEESFRSVLELIQLMESALQEGR